MARQPEGVMCLPSLGARRLRTGHFDLVFNYI